MQDDKPPLAEEGREQYAMRRASDVALKLITTSRNKRTVLGRMRRSSVAWHVAWEVVREYEQALQDWRIARYRERTGNQ